MAFSKSQRTWRNAPRIWCGKGHEDHPGDWIVAIGCALAFVALLFIGRAGWLA